jgi:Peptidase family M23
MGQPWYDYPRVDNFGTIDPQGNFWKPDSNIQAPVGTQVTALNAGTVTSIQTTSWGQSVVTIKLDNPFNTLATHEFYEHMANTANGLSVGQHVNAGDAIGTTGAITPLGFGFYSGDMYGSGSAWGTLQNDLKPGGAGLLNPVSLLNAAAGGTIPTGSGSTGTSVPPATGWIAQLGPEVQKVGIFILALVLAAFGVYILFQKQVDAAAKKGVQAAKVAVV